MMILRAERKKQVFRPGREIPETIKGEVRVVGLREKGWRRWAG
jgi:hypothetical protein